MDLKKILGTVALTVTATAALATPQYTGSTEGMPTFEDTGYYVWNDGSEWNISWFDAEQSGKPTFWFGDITFENTDLGTTSTFSFETLVDSLDVDYAGPFDSEDSFKWTAMTNSIDSVDGVTFTVESGFELLSLSLGSTLFSEFDLTNTDSGVTGKMIFIGEDKAAPNVLVTKNDAGNVFQKFEILVPEPATFALFGLGLAGLAASRRRNKNVAA